MTCPPMTGERCGKSGINYERLVQIKPLPCPATVAGMKIIVTERALAGDRRPDLLSWLAVS
jgi:hypothetical protein